MEISTFNNEEFGEIRTIQENGEVLFCGADIAKALGYSNTRDALSRHCKGVVKCDTPTNGGIQSLGFISEGNVYRLIAHSKLPGAERFEKWVFDEVLPSIRKNGAYMTEDVLEQALASPDFLIELATRLKTEKAKNAQLTVSNQIMQPKADYFDMLVDRNLLTGIRDTAKELGVRQNDFVRFLLDKGYLYRSKKAAHRSLLPGIRKIHSMRGSNQHLRLARQAPDHGRRYCFAVRADVAAVSEKRKPYLVRNLRHCQGELHGAFRR